MPISGGENVGLKRVLIKQGRAVVEEVPAPLVEAGTVLVRVRSSCVSIGTEMSAVKASSAPLWQGRLPPPGVSPVPTPPGLVFEPASTVTLGAIALQGVRRAQPTLGETFAVIGLGVLGQLTAQLLRINGCRVVGTDLERSRLALARDLGMNAGFHPDHGTDVDMVARFTDGICAGGAHITEAIS